MIAALLHGVALAAAMSGAIARAGEPAPTLPLELEGRFTWERVSEDDKGTPNVPLCRSARQTATLDVRLRRTEMTPYVATYEVVAGEWRLSGTGTGTMSFEIPEPPGKCSWTARGEESGAGTFGEGASSSLSINVVRLAGTASLGFLLADVTSRFAWEYSCPRPGGSSGSSSSTLFVTDGFEVTLEGSGDAFLVRLDGTRTSENEHVGGRYTTTTSGTLRARRAR